jgi:hypothetical protein
VRAPDRRPALTACRKEVGRVSRWSAGSTVLSGSGPCQRASTARGLRRPGSCDPSGDGSPGWRDRRGCASAVGTRASCDDDGCSAGTSACSRSTSRLWVCLGKGPPARPGRGAHCRTLTRCSSFGWHRASVEPCSSCQSDWQGEGPRTCGTGRRRMTAQRYAAANKPVKPAKHTTLDPVRSTSRAPRRGRVRMV